MNHFEPIKVGSSGMEGSDVKLTENSEVHFDLDLRKTNKQIVNRHPLYKFPFI